MRKVGLVIDSTFSIDPAYVKKHNIAVVPLKVLIDNKEFIDGQIDPQLVVEALKLKKDVKTSQPSPEAFLKAYEEQLNTYESVLCLTISKELSGTNNSATLGQTILENKQVAVVDSETTINGGAYLTEKMIAYFDQGHTLKEGLVYLEELKNKGSIIFTIDNLQTLVKSGRIGKVQAVIGNILKVKPILRFKQGVLELEHKVRSVPSVLAYLVKEAEKLLAFGKVVVRIAYVDHTTYAKQLEHDIFQLGENVAVKITGVISPVVSAHVGLGGLGVYLAYE